jgi:DNA-binding MurR/RpiR family transcriptional regulator
VTLVNGLDNGAMPTPPPQRSVAELVRERMPQLTASERKLARVLLSAYPVPGLEPIARFVAPAGVSPSTALRFVAKLGFDGYLEFQQALREEVRVRVTSPTARFDPRLSSLPSEGFVAAGFERLERVLEQTAAGLSTFDFDGAVELLVDPRRRVFTVGGRVTHALAGHLAGQLFQLRPAVHLLPSGSFTLMERLHDMGRTDVVVAFDQRRHQQDTVQFVRGVAGRGAAVVLIPDPLLSPASDVARHVLTFQVGGPPPFDSPIAGFAIVETLVAAVAARLGDAGRRRIEELERLGSGWMWDGSLVT